MLDTPDVGHGAEVTAIPMFVHLSTIVRPLSQPADHPHCTEYSRPRETFPSPPTFTSKCEKCHHFAHEHELLIPGESEETKLREQQLNATLKENLERFKDQIAIAKAYPS